MRQPTTAEVRFDEHKAASFGPVGPSILAFWLSTSWLRSNFVAADPPATEDQVQQAGNPVNVVQMAEVAVPRQMFQEILMLIAQLRAPPAPA
jgi:hypothetical protein